MSLESPSDTDFQVLGLPPGSKPSEVRKAYRTLVKRWHPDRHHSKPYEIRALAEEKFKEIDEAYRRISRSWKKRSEPRGGPRTGAHEARSPFSEEGKRGFHEARSQTVHTQRTKRRLDLRIFRSSRVVRFITPAILVVISALFLTEILLYFSGPTVDFGTQSNQQEDLSSRGPMEQTPGPQSQPIPETAEERSPVPSQPLLQSTPEVPGQFFTIGSSTSDVLAIQGPPARVQGQTWVYGLSEIQFKSGQVWRFNNFDGSLKVRMQPSADNGVEQVLDYITVGSGQNDVLSVQGTPSRVDGDRWYYGFSELRFKDGRISEYDNYFGNLKIRLLPSASYGHDSSRPFFTIGSTPDEVLAVQGTPTGIRGNTWSFSFSSVSFREGKVNYVSNVDGTLHFVAPEQLSDKSGS